MSAAVAGDPSASRARTRTVDPMRIECPFGVELERRPKRHSHAMRVGRQGKPAMLDAIIRKRIDPPLAVIARRAVEWQISAQTATVIGFLLGLSAAALVASQLYLPAVVVFLVSRFFDGLDGAIARQTRLTDLGGFLDISLDFIIYAAMVFAFALADPAANALAAAFLTTSFMGPAATFLA